MRDSNDSRRTSSAKSSGGSRRRRWEVKSKEAFETSLAIEIDSPQSRTPRYRKDTNSSESKNSSRKSGQHPTETSPSKHPAKTSADDVDSDPDILAEKLSTLIEEANSTGKTKDSKKSFKGHSQENFGTPHNEKNTANQDSKSDMMSNTDSKKAQVLSDKFEIKSLKVVESPKMKDTHSDLHTYKASAPPLSPTVAEPSPKKKKQKNKNIPKLVVMSNSNEESYISLQLKEMSDDIIDIKKEGNICTISTPGIILGPSPSRISGHVSTIFREEMTGFVVAKHAFEGAQRKNEDLYDVNQIPTRTSHALFLQGGFRTFSVLCQGLLAGIAIAHCLMIFLLDGSASGIYNVYTPVMAHVFYTLIMFLTTLCLVAACDRHDLLGLGVFSGHGIRIPWTPAFYISSLVLSLVAVRAENVLMNRDKYQNDVFSYQQIWSYVEWWRWLCVARTCLAVLAWLAVVPDPHTDALLQALQEFSQK